MLKIVLVHPQIPPNTGNIARLCAAMEVELHLVHPLGFSTADRHLKRAGLDYWPYVKIFEHNSWEDFLNGIELKKCYFFSTKGKTSFTQMRFDPDSYLIFGSETKGLSEENILNQYPSQVCTIPMKGQVRSLNLASSVSMVVSVVLHQLGEI